MQHSDYPFLLYCNLFRETVLPQKRPADPAVPRQIKRPRLENVDVLAEDITWHDNDTDFSKNGTEPAPKTLFVCPAAKHSHSEAVCTRRAQIPNAVRAAIRNVFFYLSQFCHNPISATAAAVGVHRHTVWTVISNNGTNTSSPNSVNLGRPLVYVDNFDRSVIRQIVHQYFRNNTPPTIAAVLRSVKEEIDFPYSSWVLNRILCELRFKFGSSGDRKNLRILYEREDIVAWRARYLRQIRQYRAENRSIIYLDETWFNSNEAPSRVWQDMTVTTNPWLARRAGSR